MTWFGYEYRSLMELSLLFGLNYEKPFSGTEKSGPLLLGGLHLSWLTFHNKQFCRGVSC